MYKNIDFDLNIYICSRSNFKRIDKY